MQVVLCRGRPAKPLAQARTPSWRSVVAQPTAWDGVLFAAAMAGASAPEHLDTALTQMQTSQHNLVAQLAALEQKHPGQLHAATDITGFGLLGHLGEMFGDTAKIENGCKYSWTPIAFALPGALALLAAGHSSSLAPANRRAWSLLDSKQGLASLQPSYYIDEYRTSNQERQALLELLIDPQTCGPLLISVSPTFAESLLSQHHHDWHPIGRVTSQRLFETLRQQALMKTKATA